jgi:hypothetical protein
MHPRRVSQQQHPPERVPHAPSDDLAELLAIEAAKPLAPLTIYIIAALHADLIEGTGTKSCCA